MFKKNNNESPINIASLNMISNGTTIKGNIETDGDLRIDGKIIGNVKTKSKLVLGDSGVIEGNIQCENAQIAGHIKGNTKISNTLNVKKGGKIEGEIITDKLVIESGAEFNGNCIMKSTLAAPKSIMHNEQKQTQNNGTIAG